MQIFKNGENNGKLDELKHALPIRSVHMKHNFLIFKF